LLLVGATSYRALVVCRESADWVDHTHEVIDNLQNLSIGVKNIESSQRGFALTGDEFYLTSYQADLRDIAHAEANIRGLTVGNAGQQAPIAALELLIAEKLRFCERVIGLRRTEGLVAAADAVRRDTTHRMEQSPIPPGEMRDEEQRLLVLRGATALRLNQTLRILIAGTVLGVLIVLAAGWSVRRDRFTREFAERAFRGFSVISRDHRESGASEARYRGLLEAAPDAMVVVNQNGDIVLLNVQAEKRFGYHRDELVGQKVTNIIPQGFAERLAADALRSTEAALEQQIGTGIELSGLRKDGSEFPIEIMLSPLENAEGTLVTAAIRDITVRKMAKEDLLRKVEELNRSNEELDQFAYIASHDLQEPLRMVASYTQLLSRRYKGKLDSDADEFIAFAVDGADRMHRLIQDLLAFSRVGTHANNFHNFSSEEALEQAMRNLRGTIAESGAVVTHDPLPMIVADEVQLTQLFQNLIGNGIKYQNHGNPRVHVSAAEEAARKWVFSVRDNGMGIDPQYFEKIFVIFQRLHERDEFAGTGIGLAICKKIVERHGGNISVESEPGHGSTFHFALAGNQKNL
jgi:PAS domain S-box-containing protein